MIIHDQKYEIFSSEEFRKIQATNAAHSSREDVVARARLKGGKGGGKIIKIDKLTRGSGVEMGRALACLLTGTLSLREMNGQIDGQTETDRQTETGCEHALTIMRKDTGFEKKKWQSNRLVIITTTTVALQG